MKIIKEKNSLVIKSWCENPEEGATEQAKNLAKLPFAFKQICLMPDTHQGYGMPIGGVMAAKDVIVPNAIGVDIGCGMCAVKTSLLDISKDSLIKIMGIIRKKIPVGFNKHKLPQDNPKNLAVKDYFDFSLVEQNFDNAMRSLGTLGGGNHFIEIQKGSDDHIWIMIHSGSRNLGYQVAKFYNNIAINLNDKWYSKVPKKHELAFLPLDSKDGIMYLNEMQYCVDFAFENRKLMMQRVSESFIDILKNVDFDPIINIAHNYATMENHFNSNVMVHRKGATRARLDEIGIIPGSQGTASYIVRGLGNPESFMSCSHGAGRKMGRKEAQRTLSLADEKNKLDKLGILHSIKNEKDLDEASGAYKSIDIVMKEQSDLVEPIVKLQPLAVIKG